MDIRLNEKVAEMVKELANSQGMTADEVVEKIIEWYFEDCAKEK
jgi:predicted DNA-binding protein